MLRRREGVLVRDGFLTREACEELIGVHKSEPHAGYIEHLRCTRLADLAVPRAIHLAAPLLAARHAALLLAEDFFECPLDLIPEFTSIMAWGEGSYLRSHHDTNRPSVPPSLPAEGPLSPVADAARARHAADTSSSGR